MEEQKLDILLKFSEIPRAEITAGRTRPSDLHVGRRYQSSSSLATSRTANFTGPLSDLPPKKWNRIMRNLRWTIYSVYHRLNTLVVLPNVVMIIVLGVKDEILKISTRSVVTAVSVNLTLAVLIRQDLIINALFAACGVCPRWIPLCFRRSIAKIYHLGGVHSGAATAAVLWFGIFNAVLIREWRTKSVIMQVEVFVITGVLDCLLLSITALAYPWFRTRHHNTFELVHRFAGWLAVLLFWVHIVVITNAERQTAHHHPNLGYLIIRAPAFWCLLVISFSLVLPWLRLRRVQVHVEQLSSHTVRIHFTHETPALCAAPKISDNPLREWHAFAGIPHESGKGYSVLVSRAGDWTDRIIKSPPTSLWVRGIPPRGVLHMAPIFKCTVLVATGSGIGPILSLLSARDLTCRILWSASQPVLTYRQDIMDAVLLGDPNAVIIDTSVVGRPDLVREAYNLYTISNAEAVFVISNAKVTRRVVYGLESRGIPIFAPIFDS